MSKWRKGGCPTTLSNRYTAEVTRWKEDSSQFFPFAFDRHAHGTEAMTSLQSGDPSERCIQRGCSLEIWIQSKLRGGGLGALHHPGLGMIGSTQKHSRAALSTSGISLSVGWETVDNFLTDYVCEGRSTMMPPWER